jgi:hemerythrin-like domain-containing protein
MREPEEVDRRAFFRTIVGGGVILSGCAALPPAPSERPDAAREPAVETDVSPVEDLMREHGVLLRVLLIYEECIRRLSAGAEVPAGSLADAAGLVRTFIEDYHEKLEEDFLFPRFRRADRLVDLVDMLLEQHRSGRRLTDTILALLASRGPGPADGRRALVDVLRQFVRMYAPHAAREDTILFPAFHAIVAADEFDALGEEFEKRERERFGEDGFEKTVDHVASVERRLGLYDLSHFTPQG